MEYSGALIILAAVSLIAWLTQSAGAILVEGKVWRKLTHQREAAEVWHRARGSLPRRRHLKRVATGAEPVSGALDEVPTWVADASHWDSEAAAIRRSFLKRTQETAEKWRNIFAGLLGVFGVVFFLNKPALRDVPDPDFVRGAIVAVIVLALHAVAYTGWAAAGLPKMLVDGDAVTTFQVEMRQGARALTRLRVGITAGGLTAVGLTLIVAEVLR